MRAKPFDFGIQSRGPTLEVFLPSEADGAEKEAITSTYMRSMKSKCTKFYLSFLPQGTLMTTLSMEVTTWVLS